MTPAPLISAIVPTRNRAELLRESLASMTCQTLPRDAFEVVVIDDGSDDHTQRVLFRRRRSAPDLLSPDRALGHIRGEEPRHLRGVGANRLLLRR